MSNPASLDPGTLKRSALVGAVATVADLAILAVLIDVAHVPAGAANIPALLIGLAIQFFGNKYFAFRNASPDLVRQGSLFVAVEAGAFLLNAGLFHLLAVGLGLHWLIARPVAAAAVYFGFSFGLWRKIFAPKIATNPSLTRSNQTSV